METRVIGDIPTTAAGIPRSLAPCFQEYDLDKLDPTRDETLVIERVLAYGDRHELRWLFDRYGRARISMWVQRLGVRRLPRRRYNLWCAILELSPDRRPGSGARRIWPY